MKIGIIGKGKMGTDIFHNLLQFDHSLWLICRNTDDIAGITDSINKQLKKMLKRGLIGDSEFQEKTGRFLVAADMAVLKECDIVIESINEDAGLKKELFRLLEAVVRQDCVLATNTSSLPLKVIFEACRIKDRCMGIHFFYPVKVSRFVELNKGGFTSQTYTDKAKNLLAGMGKTVLELDEDVNMILTRMLLLVITYTYAVFEEQFLTMAEIDQILKEQYVTYGIFEIIDSTGIPIIMTSIENFTDERYRDLYTSFYKKSELAVAEGYPGGPHKRGLLNYEEEHPNILKQMAEAELQSYKDNIVLRLQHVINNELAYFSRKYDLDRQLLSNAVKDVFGLSQDPFSA